MESFCRRVLVEVGHASSLPQSTLQSLRTLTIARWMYHFAIDINFDCRFSARSKTCTNPEVSSAVRIEVVNVHGGRSVNQVKNGIEISLQFSNAESERTVCQ